ncbi:hypothetical protein D3C78_1420880 [compost metagenome]
MVISVDSESAPAGMTKEKAVSSDCIVPPSFPIVAVTPAPLGAPISVGSPVPTGSSTSGSLSIILSSSFLQALNKSEHKTSSPNRRVLLSLLFMVFSYLDINQVVNVVYTSGFC